MIWINPSPLHAIFPWIQWTGFDSRSVYLTFDDGPDPIQTPRVLRMLQQKNAKGVFFLNGKKAVRHPDLVYEMHLQGHEIGNHGFSHESLFLKNREIVLDEIRRTTDVLEQITSQKTMFFRPPYGRFDLRFKQFMTDEKMKLIMWSLLSCDFKATHVHELINTIKHHIHPGAIVVLHDGHANSDVMVQALPGLIDMIHIKGFNCNTPLLKVPPKI